MWLLANNKVSRGNLAKRRSVGNKTCLVCEEAESITHIFYEFYVARIMWGVVDEVTGLPEILDFESMAKLWLRDKKN